MVVRGPDRCDGQHRAVEGLVGISVIWCGGGKLVKGTIGVRDVEVAGISICCPIHQQDVGK